MTETTPTATDDDTQENATPNQGVTTMSTKPEAKKVPPARDLERGTIDQREYACDIIGKDEAGYWHVLDRERSRVVRLDEDGIERTHAFDEHGIQHWFRWIKKELGWDIAYFVDFGMATQDAARELDRDEEAYR